jgi:hypothetical protein
MIRPSFRLLAAAAFALFCSGTAAHAQFGVYATVTLDHQTGIQSSPLVTSTTNNPSGVQFRDSVDPIGFTLGAQYDFKTFGPVRLGVDARFVDATSKRGGQTLANGSGARIYSGLGGVRAVIHTRYSFLKPYVEGAGGFARSNYGILSNAGIGTKTTYPGIQLENNFEYHIYAGTDLHVLPILDFRVFELGYGGLVATGANAHTYPLYSVSSGVVLHFPNP